MSPLPHPATGPPVDSAPAKRPQRIEIPGRLVTLSPLEPASHADALWEGSRSPEHEGLWLYLFDGPFDLREDFDDRLRRKAASDDPLFFAIVDNRSGRAAGYAA